ncbi:MAG: 40S ribosomal S19 [Trebouxia sp. A1-2]|nr:MAG: 40S ribosomal S19 [Trebouxia sp. A1-2]
MAYAELSVTPYSDSIAAVQFFSQGLCRRAEALAGQKGVMPGKGVRDVPAEAFIKAYAAHLKSNDNIKLPQWVDIVKTGAFKELAPYDPDWYYIRAASLARKVYLRQGVGVGAFRKQYGGRNKRKGAVPEHFAKASGGLIRHILIQLETEGLVEKYEGKKGGRKITSTGQRDLDLIAGRIQADEEPEEEEEDAE